MSRLRPGRRTAAILAILLLLAVAGSDLLIAGFWLSHPMLTAIVSALVVVVLSVAVIEVVLSRRAERRWRVLAQTTLMELGEAASTTWRALAEVLDLQGASEMSPDRVRAALVSDATGPKVRREIEAALMNAQLRENLAGRLAERLADGHQILGRWAVALTASETYAEIFDQQSSCTAGSMGSSGSCARGIDRPIRAGSKQGSAGVLVAGRGGRWRVVRRQPNWDNQHRRQSGRRNLGPRPACPAASVVGSSYGRSRRSHAGSSPVAGCRPLIHIASNPRLVAGHGRAEV